MTKTLNQYLQEAKDLDFSEYDRFLEKLDKMADGDVNDQEMKKSAHCIQCAHHPIRNKHMKQKPIGHTVCKTCNVENTHRYAMER